MATRARRGRGCSGHESPAVSNGSGCGGEELGRCVTADRDRTSGRVPRLPAAGWPAAPAGRAPGPTRGPRQHCRPTSARSVTRDCVIDPETDLGAQRPVDQRAGILVGQPGVGVLARHQGPAGEPETQAHDMCPAPLGVETSQGFQRHLADAVEAAGPWCGQRRHGAYPGAVVPAACMHRAREHHPLDAGQLGGREHVLSDVQVFGRDRPRGRRARVAGQVQDGVCARRHLLGEPRVRRVPPTLARSTRTDAVPAARSTRCRRKRAASDGSSTPATRP